MSDTLDHSRTGYRRNRYAAKNTLASAVSAVVEVRAGAGRVPLSVRQTAAEAALRVIDEYLASCLAYDLDHAPDDWIDRELSAALDRALGAPVDDEFGFRAEPARPLDLGPTHHPLIAPIGVLLRWLLHDERPWWRR